MKPKICLSIEDGFADVYAMHTLYTYLMENNFDAEFKVYCIHPIYLEKFNKRLEESGIKKFNSNKSISFNEKINESDIILSGSSDIHRHLDDFHNRTIAIDHSILKNSVSSTTKEQKEELRKRYGIQSNKPVIVIGFPRASSDFRISLEKIVCSLNEECDMYLIGTTEQYCQEMFSSKAKIVEKDGVLKDYYNMADVAFIAMNTAKNECRTPMHNFVEATAGGPLFLVPPFNTVQYGYRQLVTREVIREAENTDDLIAKVKKYLQAPEEEKIREQRTEHLEHSRTVYLPDILRLIDRVLNHSEEFFRSDLLAEILPPKRPYIFKVYSPRIKVCHPQTLWDLSQTKPVIPLQKIPKKLYEAFGRKE